MTRPEISPAVAAGGALPTPGGTRPWAPFRHRPFRRLWMAQLFSNLGSFLQVVGAAWLMGELGGSSTQIALLQTALTLPVFLLGVPAGALADIVDRRLLLMGTQALMMAAAATLFVLTVTDSVRPSGLLLVTFTLGAGIAMTGPAWQAIQPALVDRDEFPQAVALGSISANIGRAVGPAVAGFLIAAVGPGLLFGMNALSYIGVIGVLLLWRPERPTLTAPPETLAGAVRAGMRYGINSRALRTVLARTALFAVPGCATVALLPVIARDSLGLGATGFGVMYAAFGVGAIGAALGIGELRQRFRPDHLIFGTTVGLSVAAAGLGLTARPVVAALLAVAAGGCWSLTIASLNVAAQGAVPNWVRSRGMGLFLLTLMGSVAAGSALWGAVAAGDHVDRAMVVAGVTGLAALAGSARWRLARFEGIDVSPSPLWPEPVLLIRPSSEVRPLLVRVTYRVPESDQNRFREEMRRVERVRRRTGARRWALWQDTTDPEQFVESYVVESWEEYLRVRQRLTQTDRSIIDTVRHLRTGGEPERFLSAY